MFLHIGHSREGGNLDPKCSDLANMLHAHLCPVWVPGCGDDSYLARARWPRWIKRKLLLQQHHTPNHAS